ncbi:MAG TPA: carbon starvation CstA family protein [Chloroflexia bacterium]|nr:carbon starvation CstA family protein [Chloroflexia bacterium]
MNLPLSSYRQKALKMALKVAIWAAISSLGAFAFATISVLRGDDSQVNAVWLIVAALCTYAVAYRFYSKWLSRKVLELDDSRATPAIRYNDGRDFVPTNRWVLFGHHFAAIAGAGPLVGPVLAAQFGFLPGTIWIIIGVALAGAVQDFIVLFASMRRSGKSLGEMARDEISPLAGWFAMIAVLLIMGLLLAVLGLVVVSALAESPWGFTTIALTIPIAVLMGLWMRVWRPGKVMEASIIGIVLMIGAVFAGQWVANNPTFAPIFTLAPNTLVILLMLYGFVASVLPVWVLLAPRDYLSTFMKIGIVVFLAITTIFMAPMIKMPALNAAYAWQGQGPVVPGTLFPFLFITIACGSVSGAHALVSSGTTPKMLVRESHARLIGYGSMLMESFVAIVALVAAVTLEPGVYFAINTKIAPDQIAAGSMAMGGLAFPVTADQMANLAREVGEKTLLGRTGGAPTLAVGMAQIISNSAWGAGLSAVWYHFAIMFEALFILTTLDSGTRIARFMVQELGGHIWKPFGRTSSYPSTLVSSALIVGLWGGLLYFGVNDPNGGIKSLWALFGIANQMLAAIALVTVTTILIKMDKARFAWVTFIPLLWLIIVTFSAAFTRIFSPDIRIGFLTAANVAQQNLDKGGLSGKALSDAQSAVFNNRFDALIAVLLVSVVICVLGEGLRNWWLLLTRRRVAVLTEDVVLPVKSA